MSAFKRLDQTVALVGALVEVLEWDIGLKFWVVPLSGSSEPWVSPEWALSGPWVGPEWALSGPWVSPEWALSGPWVGPEWALSGNAREVCTLTKYRRQQRVKRVKHCLEFPSFGISNFLSNFLLTRAPTWGSHWDFHLGSYRGSTLLCYPLDPCTESVYGITPTLIWNSRRCISMCNIVEETNKATLAGFHTTSN